MNINRNEIEGSCEHYTLDVLTSLLSMQSELNRDNKNLQYEYFHYPDKIASIDRIHAYFLIKDKKETVEELLKRFNEGFYNNRVFLKPYESFSFEYDLTPFFLLKGSYNFIIKPQMPRYVMLYKNTVLPSTYNRYKLYTGEVNEVNVVLNVPNN